MIAEQEQTERRAVVQSALASQRIEGLRARCAGRGRRRALGAWRDDHRCRRGPVQGAHAARNGMKYAGDRGDPYLDSETGVLRNLLGIKEQGGLDKAESTLSFLRASELREQPVKGKFDLAHLQRIHKRLFGDVYDWAGQIRQVEISKGSTMFARQVAIQSAAQQLFGQLAKEQLLRGLDADEFSKRAGHYLGEINVLHPFREGNGRTQREFIGQLAQQAGHRIDWSGVSQARMTQASIEAYNGDSSGMAGLIRAGMPDQIFF